MRGPTNAPSCVASARADDGSVTPSMAIATPRSPCIAAQYTSRHHHAVRGQTREVSVLEQAQPGVVLGRVEHAAIDGLVDRSELELRTVREVVPDRRADPKLVERGVGENV